METPVKYSTMPVEYLAPRKSEEKEINIPFTAFWDLYAKKVGNKRRAEQLWIKLKDRDREQIIKTLPAFKAGIRDKQFQPYPERYLTGERWNDDLTEPVKPSRYGERLRHPLWQRRRHEIMARDNYTCQLCMDTETELHVHHKKYITGLDPWEYEDQYLITLCSNCHRKIS